MGEKRVQPHLILTHTRKKMATWNFRVMKFTQDNEDIYQIHEVHYDEKDNPSMYTENAYTPIGESKLELFKEFQMMLEAFDKPVLTESSFKEKK